VPARFDLGNHGGLPLQKGEVAPSLFSIGIKFFKSHEFFLDKKFTGLIFLNKKFGAGKAVKICHSPATVRGYESPKKTTGSKLGRKGQVGLKPKKSGNLTRFQTKYCLRGKVGWFFY
jgi:hypothetical protein